MFGRFDPHVHIFSICKLTVSVVLFAARNASKKLDPSSRPLSSAKTLFPGRHSPRFFVAFVKKTIVFSTFCFR